MKRFLRYWSLKRSTILVGFVLAMLGSVGAAVYVDPAQKIASEVEAQISESAAAIELLKNAQASYWLFQQQNLQIYALYDMNTKDSARETVGNLVKLAIYDRADPIFVVIGQLALSNELNYVETVARYRAVIDKALNDLTFQNFVAINAFERDFIQKAEKKVADLQTLRLNLIGSKSVADQRVNQHKLVLLVLTTLGSTFLLAANLMATRSEAAASDAMHEA